MSRWWHVLSPRYQHRFPVLGLGRRGMMMLILATLWTYIGIDLIVDKPEPVPGLLYTMWPIWIRAIEWFLPAILAIIFAFRIKDWPGWVVLLLPPLIRMVSFLYGWVIWLIPGGSVGYEDGVWDSILYVCMVLIVLTCSGWPDYPPSAFMDEGRET